MSWQVQHPDRGRNMIQNRVSTVDRSTRASVVSEAHRDHRALYTLYGRYGPLLLVLESYLELPRIFRDVKMCVVLELSRCLDSV